MKIGLTLADSEAKHQNYVGWLLGSDASTPVEVVTLSARENNVRMLRDCDALVLTGGVDVHPKFYGGQEDYPNAQPFNVERDEFEMEAFRLSQELHQPVLAICRGLQLVNVILGGTLKQDLGTANSIHRFDQTDRPHGVSISPGSLLHRFTGVEKGVVNSAHHQAIDQAGKGLRISCYSDDGIAEGAEWEYPAGKPLLLCVQWHPERMDKISLPNSPLSKTLYKKFLEEVQHSMQAK